MTDEKLKELAKMECAKLLKSEKGYNGLSFQEFWAEGMKYGLAEGKPKWHDLRENPNDLPKRENERFSWSITVTNQLGEACHYNYGKLCWETPLFTGIDEVIAWCELPKFEE